MFLVDQKDSRYFCSQGQQRTLILSLKISQLVHYREIHDRYPILLLDDVLSELDQEKQKQVFVFLNSHPIQAFVTTADSNLRDLPVVRNSAFYEVTQGYLKTLN